MANQQPVGTVTFVLGLAGSGKSHLVERIFHDGCKIEENFAHPDCFNDNHQKLVDALKLGKRCVITEVQYLCPDFRDEYIQRLKNDVGTHFNINWICFENDLAAANQNSALRTNKPDDPNGSRHIEINNFYSRCYTIPDGATIMKIHRLSIAPSTNAQSERPANPPQPIQTS